MEKKNERNTNNEGPDRLQSPGHGPQGIDKAPGEEPSQDNVNFTAETQKGKQQVDADLDKEQDRAIDKQDL